MSVVLGLDAKLYRNTGNFASPVWNEITDAMDVTVPLDKGEAEVKRRGNDWRLHVLHLKEATIDFEMLHDTDTDDYDVLKGSYFNNAVIDFLVLDGASGTQGSDGFRAECQVKSFSLNQPMEEALSESVSLRPTPTNNTQPVAFVVP